MEQEEKELITKALMQDGILFQLKCLEEIRRIKAFNFLAEEYPVSINDEPTRIDFIFSSDKNYFVFECKKANPDYKSWIFLVPNEKFKTSEITVLRHSIPQINSGSPVGEIIDRRAICFDNLNYFKSKYAIEVRFDFKKGSQINNSNKKSFSHDTIEDASFQLSKALHGFVQEKVLISRNKNQPIDESFIPILITNAELLVSKYDIKNVSSFGEINVDDLEHKKVDCILYEHARNEKIRLKDDLAEERNKLEVRADAKIRPILIINAKVIVPFFNKLLGYEEEQRW